MDECKPLDVGEVRDRLAAMAKSMQPVSREPQLGSGQWFRGRVVQVDPRCT